MIQEMRKRNLLLCIALAVQVMASLLFLALRIVALYFSVILYTQFNWINLLFLGYTLFFFLLFCSLIFFVLGLLNKTKSNTKTAKLTSLGLLVASLGLLGFNICLVCNNDVSIHIVRFLKEMLA